MHCTSWFIVFSTKLESCSILCLHDSTPALLTNPFLSPMYWISWGLQLPLMAAFAFTSSSRSWMHLDMLLIIMWYGTRSFTRNRRYSLIHPRPMKGLVISSVHHTYNICLLNSFHIYYTYVRDCLPKKERRKVPSVCSLALVSIIIYGNSPLVNIACIEWYLFDILCSCIFFIMTLRIHSVSCWSPRYTCFIRTNSSFHSY